MPWICYTKYLRQHRRSTPNSPLWTMSRRARCPDSNTKSFHFAQKKTNTNIDIRFDCVWLWNRELAFWSLIPALRFAISIEKTFFLHIHPTALTFHVAYRSFNRRLNISLSRLMLAISAKWPRQIELLKLGLSLVFHACSDWWKWLCRHKLLIHAYGNNSRLVAESMCSIQADQTHASRRLNNNMVMVRRWREKYTVDFANVQANWGAY